MIKELLNRIFTINFLISIFCLTYTLSLWQEMGLKRKIFWIPTLATRRRHSTFRRVTGCEPREMLTGRRALCPRCSLAHCTSHLRELLSRLSLRFGPNLRASVEDTVTGMKHVIRSVVTRPRRSRAPGICQTILVFRGKWKGQQFSWFFLQIFPTVVN